MNALPPVDSPWQHAIRAAALFAVDPCGAAGVLVHAHPGPVRDTWLALARELLPERTPWRRIPLHVSDERLLGGLDLTATLEAGQPVVQRGILAEADGGVVVAAMAERMTRAHAAMLGSVLDDREIHLERDGVTRRIPARIGVIALDEGLSDEERPAPALCERLAFHLDLKDIALSEAVIPNLMLDIAGARERLSTVELRPDSIEALCSTAAALGIASSRAVQLCLRVARASAALAGRDQVSEVDLQRAACLVLVPRAQALPAGEPEHVEDPSAQDEHQPPEDEQPDGPEEEEMPSGELDLKELEEMVLEAALAALPPKLLETLRLRESLGRQGSAPPGRAGLMRASLRGRPAGTRRGSPDRGARLNVVETLRSAAPWQPMRRRAASAAGDDRTLQIRREDFRLTRYQQKSETTAIFAIDASGSTALQRLAEAKGAIELLLADCYARRDQVALVSFRGKRAELVLPVTRSLVRAKRCLSSMAGGGGTPLASGIDAAAELAASVRTRGGTPLIVLLTDGRANVARDAVAGRARAAEDALASARSLRRAGIAALLVDTSKRPQPDAERLAKEMEAKYLPLPHADATALCGAVKSVTAHG